MERAKTERAKNEANRQRHEQITTLSQQAIGLARASQWHQVLAKMEEIRAIDPGFVDTDQLAVTARAEIERQTQETQREAQLAEMYAAAVKSLDAREYQKALQQWGEVQALDPKYPDRKRVQKTAKKKLKELAEPKRPPRKLPKRLVPFLGLMGIIFIMGFVYFAVRSGDRNISEIASSLSALITSPTPTIQLTPTRRPTSTPAPPKTIYDNFNDAAYDGSYNQNLWRISGLIASTGSIVQNNGMVSFSIEKKDNEAGVLLIPSLGYTFDSQFYTEARLMVDKSSYKAHMGLEIALSQGYAFCLIMAESTDDICCWAGNSTTSKSSACQQITPGTWHKIKIEVTELKPATFEFYIDDKNIGQIIPDPDWHATNRLDGINIGVNTYSEKLSLCYLDDFILGPVK